MKKIAFLLILTGLSYFLYKESQPTEHLSQSPKIENELQNGGFKVTHIQDGDSFIGELNNEKITIRLKHVDCPENGQAFGRKAKEFTSANCLNKIVQLIHNNERDQYNRLIAEVILPTGENHNKLLVENGFAWHNTKFSSDESYHSLEQEARKSKKGLWTDKNPVAPWEFRKLKRNQ